jgi:formate dehydrogenase
MTADIWDQGLLDDLCTVMADSSICGLGQAAVNPVRMTIKHFAEEVT